MKKSICLITAAALMLSACSATAFAAENSTESSRKLISSYEESRTYSGDELLYTMTVTDTYDEMGSVISKIEVTDYLDGSEPVPVIYDYELSYNDQGLISGQILNLSGFPFYERTIEYDDYGNPVKMVEFNVPNTYTTVDENEYNDADQLIGKVEYFTISQDEMISETISTYTYTYDDAGLLSYFEYTTEAEGLDPFTNSISYEYDSEGNIISEVQKYGTASESDLTYTYIFAPDGSIESTNIVMISHYTDMEDIITESTITYQYE